MPKEFFGGKDFGFATQYFLRVYFLFRSQTKKTRVIQRDLNPVWNQDLTFNIVNVSDRDRCSLTAVSYLNRRLILPCVVYIFIQVS
jgi:hypothetical protein